MAAGELQDGLLHGTGLFSAVVTVNAGDRANELPAIAARLLTLLQQKHQGIPENLHIVVALKASLLALPSVPPFASPAPFQNSPADALIQISAATAADRALGFRIVHKCFSEVAANNGLTTVQGARLLDAQESFGFRDGAPVSQQQILERAAGAEQGTWLFYQRLAQNVGSFLAKPNQTQVDVMGRVPRNLFGRPEEGLEDTAVRANLKNHADTEPNREADRERAGQTALPASHYRTMTRAPLAMVRRGFPYQDCGNEGLAFIAVAREPSTFETALKRMTGAEGPGDRLMEFITPVEGGLYFCPSLEWLRAATGLTTGDAASLPASAARLQHKTELTTYITSESLVKWMLELRARGAFEPGPPTPTNPHLAAHLRPDLQEHMDAIYRGLEGPNSEQKMKELQKNMEDDSGEINTTLDDYLTFN